MMVEMIQAIGPYVTIIAIAMMAIFRREIGAVIRKWREEPPEARKKLE
jgi:hypothetical protein